MIRIAAFTAGRAYTSARFRVRQYIPDLAGHRISVREHIAPIYKHLEPRWHHPGWLAGIRIARPLALAPSIARSHRGDASWIQKEMIWGRDTLERFTKGPRFFDVDDAVWVPREGAAEQMARLARRVDVVIAGNSTIADWFSRFSADVRVIPTAIDTSRYTPAAVGEVADHPFTIVWTGQAVTLYHLAVVEPALKVFMDRHPDVRLHVVSDVAPALSSLPPTRVRFIPWSPEGEVQSVREADVGIMPLVDDENGRAKCSFKMLQYMACGKPSLVTPIGFNNDILGYGDVGLRCCSTDEWVDALEHLYDDSGLCDQLGEEGRRVAATYFDRPLIAAQLADLFNDVVTPEMARSARRPPPPVSPPAGGDADQYEHDIVGLRGESRLVR